jgi:hypothetical protein
MSKTRRTINRDSVFRRTDVDTEAPAQGVSQEENPVRQTAVWLSDEEVDWLDDKCQEIRRSGWRGITRSALIRALIRATMEQSADLSGVTAEPEITQRLVSQD